MLRNREKFKMVTPGLLTMGKIIITEETVKNDLVTSTSCSDWKYRIAPSFFLVQVVFCVTQ